MATWKLVSSKSLEPKSESVIVVKLSRRIRSPLVMLCALANVIVTVASLLVVEKALVNVVVLLRGVIS